MTASHTEKAPEAANNMLIVVPAVAEQIGIREQLDAEVGKVRTLSQKIMSSIRMLREYRTALISAAVTGKIDVRKEIA